MLPQLWNRDFLIMFVHWWMSDKTKEAFRSDYLHTSNLLQGPGGREGSWEITRNAQKKWKTISFMWIFLGMMCGPRPSIDSEESEFNSLELFMPTMPLCNPHSSRAVPYYWNHIVFGSSRCRCIYNLQSACGKRTKGAKSCGNRPEVWTNVFKGDNVASRHHERGVHVRVLTIATPNTSIERASSHPPKTWMTRGFGELAERLQHLNITFTSKERFLPNYYYCNNNPIPSWSFSLRCLKSDHKLLPMR